MLLATPLVVGAQPAGPMRKVARLGFLRAGEAPASYMEDLRQGLREAGLVEGQHYAIEMGIVPGAAQLPAAAATLLARQVDVLIASGTPSVLPAKHATRTVPVVSWLPSILSRPGSWRASLGPVAM